MILACRHCRLLFEAATSVAQFCPRCERPLVRHHGEGVAADHRSQHDDMFGDTGQDRTELLSENTERPVIPSISGLRIGDIDLSHDSDDIAHFGSSHDGLMAHTRLLSNPNIVKGPGGDETRMLPSVDESFDAQELTAALADFDTDYARTEAIRTQPVIDHKHPTDDVDILTSAVRTHGSSTQQSQRAKPPQIRSAAAPPPFKPSQRKVHPDKNQSDSRSKKPSVQRMSSRSSHNSGIAGPPPFRHTMTPPLLKPQSGPDPSPQYGRTPKAGRPHLRRAPVQPQGTLDHARPKALPTSARPPVARPVTRQAQSVREGPLSGSAESPKQGRASVRDVVSDSIGDMIAQHRISLPTSEFETPVNVPAHSSRMSPIFWFFAALTIIGSFVVVIGRAPSGTKGEEVRAIAQQRDELAMAVDALRIRPLPVQNADLAIDIPYVALSADGVRSSFGSGLGLTSLNIPDARITSDEKGSWIELLRKSLSAASVNKERMAIALSRTGLAKQVWLLAQSVERAGFARSDLVVERISDGELGLLPFSVVERAIPSAGQMAVRLDDDGLFTSVIARDGSRLTDDMPPVSRRSNGELDFPAIDERFETLTRRFPLIRSASLHVDPQLGLQDLVHLMHSICHGPEKERFTALILRVR